LKTTHEDIKNNTNDLISITSSIKEKILNKEILEEMLLKISPLLNNLKESIIKGENVKKILLKLKECKK
jgi:hypothetical protein